MTHLRFPCLLVLMFSVVGPVNAEGPSVPFNGVGKAEVVFSPHPTLPAPMLLITATEEGHFTHFGESTLVSIGDFDPISGSVENGETIATAADGSTAYNRWSAQLLPDGSAVTIVTWDGGTGRFVNLQGECTVTGTPLTANTFENVHSGTVSF